MLPPREVLGSATRQCSRYPWVLGRSRLSKIQGEAMSPLLGMRVHRSGDLLAAWRIRPSHNGTGTATAGRGGDAPFSRPESRRLVPRP